MIHKQKSFCSKIAHWDYRVFLLYFFLNLYTDKNHNYFADHSSEKYQKTCKYRKFALKSECEKQCDFWCLSSQSSGLLKIKSTEANDECFIFQFCSMC